MSRSRNLVLILAMAAGLMTACTASATPGPHPSAEPAPRLPLTKVLAAVRRAPAIRTLPSRLRPSLTGAGQDLGFDSDKCEAGPSATRIDACVFGDPASSTRVVLFGDSHAAMWLPAMIEIAQRRHWQLRFLGKPACPIPDITVWSQRDDRAFTECDRFRSFAEGQILAARPDLVLVTSESYGQKIGPDQTVTATEWQGGFTRTLGALRRSGARVVVIGDTPVLVRSAPECLAAHARNIVTCFTTRATATGRVWSGAEEAAAEATGSGYVPVLPWLCGSVCTPVIGNVLVYRNRFDITATYSRMLNGVLEAALVRQFPPRPQAESSSRSSRLPPRIASFTASTSRRPLAIASSGSGGTARFTWARPISAATPATSRTATVVISAAAQAGSAKARSAPTVKISAATP
jgi:SGNH domain-containing protein